VKPFLVVNPRSGGGSTGRTFGAMRGTIERALGPCDVAMTERPGHGAELARAAAEAGHPLVVAVGGDGTIHEVVNGLLASKAKDKDKPDLGVVGQGTGGDFRKTLGIEHRLDRYLDAITSGKKRPIDVGRFSGGGKASHHFVNILSAGMGGLVDKYVADAPRLLGGKAAYFGATLKALLAARLGRVRCVLTDADGQSSEHELVSFMIAICNGRYFGGGMKVAPMAELDDGVFEIVALGATSKIGFAMTSGTIYSGAHIGQSGTVHLRGRKVRLELVNAEAQSAYLLDVDGEPMGGLPLEIECLPKALVVRG
jgi:YegS/Rv2252/BmrU family lipid kinase